MTAISYQEVILPRDRNSSDVISYQEVILPSDRNSSDGDFVPRGYITKR